MRRAGPEAWKALSANGKRLYPDPENALEPDAQHLVQDIRKAAGLPKHVTLEACRHGGMTEFGDTDLTEQQILP